MSDLVKTVIELHADVKHALPCQQWKMTAAMTVCARASCYLPLLLSAPNQCWHMCITYVRISGRRQRPSIIRQARRKWEQRLNTPYWNVHWRMLGIVSYLPPSPSPLHTKIKIVSNVANDTRTNANETLLYIPLHRAFQCVPFGSRPHRHLGAWQTLQIQCRHKCLSFVLMCSFLLPL